MLDGCNLRQNAHAELGRRWNTPVEPGLDGGVAAVIGEAGGSEVVGQGSKAVQLSALIQRAAKLRHHNREFLRRTALSLMWVQVHAHGSPRLLRGYELISHNA